MFDEIDGHEIAAQVKLMRTNWAGAVLVVEGETDQKLLDGFVDDAKCEVVCAYGKPNVLDAIRILVDQGVVGVLGFVDSDFDRIDGVGPDSEDIVTCDFADSEMMMLASPALEKVLGAYGNDAKVAAAVCKCPHATLREHLFEEGAKIASLRYAAKKNGWSLKFKDLDYAKFVHAPSLMVDLGKATKAIVANSKIEGLSPDVVAAAAAPLDTGHDRRDFCAGHDCTFLLAIGFKQALAGLAKQVATKENVEKWLRLAYEARFFRATNVYQEIRTWEGTNHGFWVLIPETAM